MNTEGMAQIMDSRPTMFSQKINSGAFQDFPEVPVNSIAFNNGAVG